MRESQLGTLKNLHFSSNVGANIWNWELGSIGKEDHDLMDNLTVGEVHYENMVCTSLLGWAPIELFGPFLVEQSGVFFSSLEDLSWFVRFTSHSTMHPIWPFPTNIWTYDSKLRRKFPKVLDLETCLLSEKAARRGLAREAVNLKKLIDLPKLSFSLGLGPGLLLH